MSLEEKWAARWLAPVLALGGLLPTGGILLAEMVVGKAAIPLAVAYLVVPVVPLGYMVVLRQYGRQIEAEPAPRWQLSAAAGILTVLAVMNVGTLGAMVAKPPEQWGVALLLAGGAYPLFRILQWWLSQELYGGWYRRERILRGIVEAGTGGSKEEEIWSWVVRQVALGVEAQWACVEVSEGETYRWSGVQGEPTGSAGERGFEVPIRAGGREYGRLRLGAPVGREGYTPEERRWVEAVARLVGLRLAWGEREAEARRLQATLAARREEARPTPCPLSERELDILRLVAAGMSDREIADELHLSRKTVESHLGRIYAKLGVRNRVAAVAIAVGERWIEAPRWYRGTKGNP